jgi:hypothetical protein
VTRATEWVRAVRGWLLVLVLVAGLAFAGGRAVGERELAALMDLPAGAAVLSTRHGALFWTDARDAQALRWKRIPTPEQARIVQLFPAAPAATTTVPTTTTPPTTAAPKRRRP